IVQELNEANNAAVSSTPLTVTLFRPDLVMRSVSGPPTGATGRPITINSTVGNQGTSGANAGPFQISFYLTSSSTTVTPGVDRLLGNRSVTNLAVGVNASAPTTVTIPVDVVPGTYYVGAVAD